MSKYDYVVDPRMDWLGVVETRKAFRDIDARLSALEAAQKKPDAPTPEQREPGLYTIQAANGLYAVRRWTLQGCWVSQSGYVLPDESKPVWIGPRIQERGE